MDINQLEKLGFKQAVSELKEKQELKRKMSIAYEHFRYVKPEKFDAFNEKLKEKTLKETGEAGKNLYHNYDKLAFISVEKYATIPPQDILDKIEEAQKMECFDTFEICKIESIHEYKDPIVFGVINGCPDKFFVAQWLDDIKIEDILMENEG